MSVAARIRRLEQTLAKRVRRDADVLWRPYPDSPQEAAYESEATICGFGGAAGGGKSALALGLALTRHRKSIIFRREAPQLREIIEQSRELVQDRGTYNSVLGLWRLDDGRTLELASVQYEKDCSKFRGRPHDLIAIDECQDFSENQVRFLMGWLRTVTPGQRCRAVFCFNPPSTAEGRWLVEFFAPWLREDHPRPAAPGELRWFAMVGGKEVERPDGTPFEHDGEVVTPLSRTFIPARLKDNPALERTGYRQVLQALPEPLRSQLLYGDFKAGLLDDEWQAIPSQWIKAAQARWRPDAAAGVITAAGLDVAHGGSDRTVLACRRGRRFDELRVWPGSATPTGDAVAARVMLAVGSCRVPIQVDCIGYGASAYERLAEDYRCYAVPIDFSRGSECRDRTGTFEMRNLRAECFWRFREALDPEHGEALELPPDPELLTDLTSVRYKVTPGGLQLESKEEIRKRIGMSCDKGDAVVLAHYTPPGLPSPFCGTAVPEPKALPALTTSGPMGGWRPSDGTERGTRR